MMPDDHEPDTPAKHVPKTRRLRPFQFDIRTLLILTAILSIMLAALRWLELSRGAMLLVIGITALSTLAAVGLVVALSLTMGQKRDREE